MSMYSFNDIQHIRLVPIKVCIQFDLLQTIFDSQVQLISSTIDPQLKSRLQFVVLLSPWQMFHQCVHPLVYVHNKFQDIICFLKQLHVHCDKQLLTSFYMFSHQDPWIFSIVSNMFRKSTCTSLKKSLNPMYNSKL